MSREIVPLGLLFSQTGSYGEVGKTMHRGAMLAVCEVNADPASGVTFDVQSIDPGGRNDRYISGARDMLARGNVRHVIGCYTSWSRKEVLPVFEKHDGLLWYPSHYEGFETSENIVYTGAAPNQHVVPLVHFMLAEGARSAFFVGSNYIWAWENHRIMRDILNRNGGRVLGERYVPIGECDLDEIIGLILRQRPDFIFNNLIGESSYTFFRRLRARCDALGIDQPLALPVVSCSLAEPELQLIGAAACDGHLSSSVYFSSIRSPENERYLRAWAAAYPEAGQPSADAEATYNTVHLLARAIEEAGGAAEPQAVLAGLASVSVDAPQGTISVDPENWHSYLWPRIGRSRADGTFDLVHASARVVRPDPYLVWEPLSLEAAGEPVLRVVS